MRAPLLKIIESAFAVQGDSAMPFGPVQKRGRCVFVMMMAITDGKTGFGRIAFRRFDVLMLTESNRWCVPPHRTVDAIIGLSDLNII